MANIRSRDRRDLAVRLWGFVFALVLASCGGEGSSPGRDTTSSAPDTTSSPIPNQTSPPIPGDDLVDICNTLVLHINAFNDISNALLEPGVTVEEALTGLEESWMAFASDATAFEAAGESKIADNLSELSGAIEALGGAIDSSDSVRVGLRSELANMQRAVVVLG